MFGVHIKDAAMKDLLITYCEFNVWANDRLFDATMQLPDEAHRQEVVSSFPSLYLTWLHIWSAQYLWMARFTGGDVSQRPAKVFNGTMTELRDGLQASAREWVAWTRDISEGALAESFTVHGASGRSADFVRRDVVMQVMDHGSYHRGQIVTMLRQLGLTEIPSTDFVRFTSP
jgi:uncharacterized damage-inducible protein DinB